MSTSETAIFSIVCNANVSGIDIDSKLAYGPTMETSDTLTAIYGAIGKSIRDRRRQLGWTQERLAKLLSISRASIANIESGRQKLLVHTLLELATVLQLDAADLLPRVTAPETIKNLERFSEADRNFLTVTIEDGNRDVEDTWLSDEGK